MVGLATLTLVIMSRLLDQLLTWLMGSSATGGIVIAVLLFMALSACLLVAGLSLVVGLGERSQLARATLLVAALGHLVLGLGQVNDLIQGVANGLEARLGILALGAAFFLVAGLLAREWWRMRAASSTD